jgi:hypothetical protein
MKNLFPIFVLTLLTLVSCNQTADQQTTKSADTASVKEDSTNSYTPTYYDYKKTSLSSGYRDSLYAKFSSDTTEDCFILNVPKGLVTETKTTLCIVTKQGEIIYEHTFPTSDLINGYATEEIKTDKEMELYILSEAKSILDQNSFRDLNKLTEEDGIINQTDKDGYENYDVFIECKNDRRPLYCYGLQEEDIRFLGYSRKLKKVVIVLTCC